MAIFKKRPLAAACIALIIAAIVAFSFSVFYTVLLLIPLAVAFLCLLIYCLAQGFSYTRLFAFLLLFCILLGAGRTLLLRRQVRSTSENMIGETVNADFKVERVATQSTYESRLIVRLTDLNGEPCRERVLFITDGATPFYIGDCVSGRFLCAKTSDYSYYQGQETQYRADNIYVAFTVAGDGQPVLLEDGTNALQTKISDFLGTLHYQLTSAVSGEKGELISGLLLGTRESLDEGTVLQFRRVGLSHLLALSGLHLTIIAGALEMILRFCRVSRRGRAVILPIILFLYWILTGCSFSMLRAVLMFIVLQLSFFAKEDYDGFTALCMVGALTVLVNPGVIYDLSFQMTMLATFGILAFGDLQGKLLSLFPHKKSLAELGFKVLRFFASSLFITLTATLAILPIQWLIFGEMSLLAPIANLIMIPLATVLLWLSLLLLPLSFFPAAAFLPGIPAGWISEAMLGITEKFSRLHGMLSLNYEFVPYILIPLILLTVLLLILDLKKLRVLTLAPTGMAILAFVLCLIVSDHWGQSSVDVVYRTTGKNDGLLLVQNGSAVICDISNGSATQLRKDYQLLQEHCATEVEVLMLTHYHTRQITAFSRFTDSVMLRTLWLPRPQTAAETEIMTELLSVAARKGVAVTVYDYDVPLTVFNVGTLTLSVPLYESRSVEAALDLRISYAQTSLTYQSDAYSEYVRNAGTESRRIADDYLILGGHGPVPHGEVAPTLEILPREIVIAGEDAFLLHTAYNDTSYVLFPETVIYRLQ